MYAGWESIHVKNIIYIGISQPKYSSTITTLLPLLFYGGGSQFDLSSIEMQAISLLQIFTGQGNFQLKRKRDWLYTSTFLDWCIFV